MSTVLNVVSVPGNLNFVAQLQITFIHVTWQVSVVRIYILITGSFPFSASFTDSWLPSPSLCSVI